MFSSLFCQAVCQPRDSATDTVRFPAQAVAEQAGSRGPVPEAPEQQRPQVQEGTEPAAERPGPAGEQQPEQPVQPAQLEQPAQPEAPQRAAPARCACPETGRAEEEQATLEEECSSEPEACQSREELQHVRKLESAVRRGRFERRETVKDFYKRNGFRDANWPRHSGCSFWPAAASTTYPLILAAERGDPRLVSMLLQEGANPNLRNSAKQTALQAAVKKNNKAGSHDKVIRLLRNAANPSAGGA